MHFNWLHLTDLHCGMKEQAWLWQNVKERLFEDLEYLHPKSGPWDLILFTGDLTDRGTKDQFDQVDLRLQELTAWVAGRQGGREPILLAVPGNHDLQRPKDDDEGLGYLRGWADNPTTQDTIWTKPDSVVRKTVESAFAEYSAWWGRQAACQGKAAGIDDFRPGLLPGDFSATFENASGCRLGILGLNTAFLQLAAGDYKRKLALHARQFHAACGGDGPEWAKGHHACLLMTHQPPDWLDDASRQHLDGEITNNGRFAMHLCGHMHEPKRLLTAQDGNQPKVLFLARSLFGLEKWGERGQEQQRLHGYAAGRITPGPDDGSIILWPRSGERSGAELHLDRDPHQGLPRGGEATKPYRFDLPRPCRLGPPPPPPDEVFDRALAELIDKELAAPAAAPLKQALVERLAPASGSGAALCRLEKEPAVAELAGAIGACLARVPRGESSRELRNVARRLLGWLLMRFIREEWCAEEHRTRTRQDAAANVEVGSEAGAEVLWTRWSREDEPPDFRVIRCKVVGRRNLLAGTPLPEEGWEDWTRYLDDAKAALWGVLFGEAAPPTFGDRENERLRQAFGFHVAAARGSRYYLTVNERDIRQPLAQPEVIDALRRDLGLPVLRVADGPEDRFFTIEETRLGDMIKQCLKTLKDHGDD